MTSVRSWAPGPPLVPGVFVNKLKTSFEYKKLSWNINSFKDQFKTSFLYKTVGICVFSLRENKRTGNGTYGTRHLFWLQFGSVSTNKFFPADTLSANKVKHNFNFLFLSQMEKLSLEAGLAPVTALHYPVRGHLHGLQV